MGPQILDFLQAALPGVTAVYLFGSRARGDANGESDIDVAVLCPTPIPAMTRWELQEDLAGILHSPVDLVDLRNASTVMRVRVLADGKLLFDADPSSRAHFEAFALAAYARLNEERAAIVEQAQRTGRVHG